MSIGQVGRELERCASFGFSQVEVAAVCDKIHPAGNGHGKIAMREGRVGFERDCLFEQRNGVIKVRDGIRIRYQFAAGLHGFADRPAPLGSLPAELVSHSSDHLEFTQFSGRSVLVVGAGQSALESAAFLSQAGAEVEVVVRAPSVVWLGLDPRPDSPGEQLRALMRPPTDVGGRIGWVAAAPDLFRVVPGRFREVVTKRCLIPRAGQWLKPPLADVRFTLERRIADAEPAGSGVCGGDPKACDSPPA